MTGREDTPPEDPILRDPTRLIDADARITSGQYQAEYPDLPAERAQYLTRSEDGEIHDFAAVHVGSVIDGYRIRRQIGRGGMGVVFEAEQLSLGRTVALKVLPPMALRNERSMNRFRGEATAVARLSHPRIVAVHGFNVRDGVAYLAMEYVDGLDLAEVLDRLKAARTHGRRFVRISGPNLEKDIIKWAQGRKLMGTMPGDPRIRNGIVVDLRNPFPMMVAIVADVADALRHAHAHGVIHRDIKPSNLLLDREGRIKLSDFGLAKDIDAASVTESGDFVGSPAYVSPEQASTRRARVDERSDIYSLGVTLYELLTLHQPFSGKNVAVILKQILTGDPPLPTALNPRIPRDLETIVLEAIERDPSKRYQTAEAFGDDLRRFLNFEPVEARPRGPGARSWRFVRRHRVAAALVSMGLLIVTLVGLLARGLGDDGGRAELVSRTASYLAARGLTTESSEEVAELLAELSHADQASSRRAAIQHVAEVAQARLDQDDGAGLIELLTVMDAQAELAQWSGDERRLHRSNALGIKIGLVRLARERLKQGGLDARTRRAWLAALERLLDDPDGQVCKSAAVVLGEMAAPSSLGALQDALNRRLDPRGRVALIGALAAYGHEDAVPLLAGELGSVDPWIRLAALDALETLGPPGLVGLIAPLSRDPEVWVRQRYDDVIARRRGRSPP
jgi:serine/threonine protein kinase